MKTLSTYFISITLMALFSCNGSSTQVKASKQAVSVGTKDVKVSIIPGKN